MADTSPIITREELLRRLASAESTEDEVLPYLIEVPSSGSIEPRFQPNPSRVSGLETGLEGGAVVQLLNGWRMRQRHRAYRDRLAAGWTGPRIVAEGDSWFQYPTRLQDVIDHLMHDHAILCFSAAGDTLSDMMSQDQVIGNVGREGATAVLFSAGGNDLFQNGNIATLIEPVFPGAKPSDLLGSKLDAFLTRIIGDYRAYLHRIHSAHPQVHILIHGYGPAFSRNGAWIGRPLKQKGVSPVEVQNALIRLLLGRFNAALAAMAAEPAFHGRLAHLDVTDIGQDPGDWHDEIHLDGPHAAHVAERFRAELARRLGDRLEGGVENFVTPPDADAPRLAAIASHAEALMALSEGYLEAELDRRLQLIALDPSEGDKPAMELLILSGGGLDTGLEGGLSGISALARRLLLRWEREMHDLICGSDAADVAEREKLADALNLGGMALVGAVTTWLATGPLAVPALVAGVLAAILVKRIGASTKSELCAAWAERLDAVRS